MKIIAVDDEKIALQGLLLSIKRAAPEAEVLGFRRAIRPLFALLLFSLFIPEVRLSEIWLYAMGIYLVCVVWNFIASRVKRNTGNEKEYLNFVYDLKKVKLPRQKHIEEICNTVKIAHVYDRMIRNLSKGYKQRVGVAQALLGSP